MGTVVDATVRSGQFVLADTFDRLPTATFEALPVGSPEANTVMPFLCVDAPASMALESVLSADATTETVDLLSRDNRVRIFRIRWRSPGPAVVGALVSNGVLVTARAREDHWSFRLLFADRDDVSATIDACRKVDVDLQISRVVSDTEPVSRDGDILSEKQFHALSLAFERGYFAIPRRITLENLADEVGVSHQALSERLRRGQQVVLSELLRHGNGYTPHLGQVMASAQVDVGRGRQLPQNS
jgi:predicted DNA binding protein